MIALAISSGIVLAILAIGLIVAGLIVALFAAGARLWGGMVRDE